MKQLPLLLAISLTVTPLISSGQVSTVFNDSFSSGTLSTLNPTAASPGTLSSSQTAYDIASSKGATTSALVAGSLTLGPISTSSGYIEASAMFTGTPITLNTPGQFVELYYTFIDTTNNFNNGGANNEQVILGLYNSGGSPPTNGTALWNSGLASGSTTAATGGAQKWLGYSGEISYSQSSGQSSTIATRPAQSSGNNLAQALGITSGYSSGSTIGTLAGGSAVPIPTLTVSNKYTLALTLTYVNATTLTCTVTLYNGVGIGGTVVSSGSYNAAFSANTTTAQDITDTFDSLEVGFRPTGSSSAIANRLEVTGVTVITGNPIAPAITGLSNETVVAGTTTTLSPTVTGVPIPVLQWQINGTNVNGATSPALTLTNVQYVQNGYQYSLIASNSLGLITNSMTLSVIVPPSITGLNNQASAVSNTVVISPTVGGIPTPTLQWQTNFVNITDGPNGSGSGYLGTLTSTLTITNVQLSDGLTYSLVASNSAGMVTNSMMLTVAASNILATITGLTNVTVVQGNNATFGATASAVPLPTLQWLDQTGTPIPGATNSTLTLNNVQFSQNAFTYSLVASNVVGSVTNSAMLIVEVPPTITAQPVGVVVTNTQQASFTVAATGSPAVAYQWFQGTNAISVASNPTANSATLVIASAVATNIGAYSVVVTNVVGTTNSASVSLVVNSIAIAPTATAPANGATGVCYDTPLSITFNQPPGLGITGQIRIYNVTNSTTPVEIIDLSSNNPSGLQTRAPFPGEGSSFNYYPVVINGNTANIYPHSGDIMNSNQTYYVTIGEGVFTDSTGAYFPGITATNAWQFATKHGGPVDPVNPVVNANGSADFVTVQGALDSLATNAASLRRVVSIAPGFYFEIVDDAAKTNVTIRGQSRSGTVIFYPNNANVAVGGSTHDRMTFKLNANDVGIENLTISNSTPQGGSQAEALMIEGNSATAAAKRCIINNCEIDSRQDTVLANINASQAFFYHTRINGNFDYIWGGGNLFFLDCTMHTISGASSQNLTAARTDTASSSSTNTPWVNPNGTTFSANGFSFLNCTMEADAGITSTTLGDNNGTAGGLVSWAFCQFNTNAYIPPQGTLSNSYVFWQYQNTDTNGVNPATFTNVQTIGTSPSDPRLLAVTNIQTWFYGWVPALAPNLISLTGNQTAGLGQSASFAASATGYPDPAYQWYQNGSPIPGATSATYAIASAVRTNSGDYFVVASNGSGSVTSSVVTLNYVDTPPVASPATYMRNSAVHQLNISVTNLLSNVTDADGDAISLVSVGVSTNGVTPVISGNYVVYFNTNAVADQFPYTVTDGFGGTNSSFVTINVSTQPLFGQTSPAVNTSGGSVSLSFAGIPGYSYSVLRSTNVDMSNSSIVLTTNAPSGGVFLFTDPAPPQPTAYYQLEFNP